jgi:hypothetical protein
MSRLFWLELAAIAEGVLIVVLFVRISRVENVVRGILVGWKRGR